MQCRNTKHFCLCILPSTLPRNTTWFLPRCSYAGEVLLWASLRLSVCLWVKRVDCDKTKARSEKSSIMTNRKSPTSFPMSLRWTAYVAPNQGTSKAVFFRFPYKDGLFSKKVCYKVSLCGKFQRQSCKAFTGLSNRAQMVGEGRPLLPEILGQSDPPLQKRRLPIDIRSLRLNHTT